MNHLGQITKQQSNIRKPSRPSIVVVKRAFFVSIFNYASISTRRPDFNSTVYLSGQTVIFCIQHLTIDSSLPNGPFRGAITTYRQLSTISDFTFERKHGILSTTGCKWEHFRYLAVERILYKGIVDFKMDATVERTQTAREEKLDWKEILDNDRRYRFLRRTQDVLLSVLALLVLWPVMLITAAAICIDSPGSPIFVQNRVGRGGKVFRFFKFRSMVRDAESMQDGLMEENEMEGPAFKIRDDPRITRVGRIIRRASIDELPQLFNVLRGDMTIVGPRPPLPREVDRYDDYDRQRLYVTPGLTCYWQIRPNRYHCTFDEWMELDLRYIRERSFLTDWKIILKTFGAVLNMDGE